MKLKIVTLIFLGQVLSAQVGVNTTQPLGVFHVDGARDNPAFGLPSAAQQANDFVLTPDGRMGVGTINPFEKAEVNGNLQINNVLGFQGSYIRVRSSGGASLTLQASNTNSNYGRKGVIGTETNDPLQLVYGLRSILFMNGSGLHPNTPNTYSLGSTANAYHTIYANNTVSPSDIRFKKDIKDINYGIKDILKIRPVSYLLKEEENPNHYLGFIAQEIEKIVPEIVKTEEGAIGYKSVDYVRLIPILVKGMQDQQKKIDELTTMIQEMKASGKD